MAGLRRRNEETNGECNPNPPKEALQEDILKTATFFGNNGKNRTEFGKGLIPAWFNLGLHMVPPVPPPIGGGTGGPQVLLAATFDTKAPASTANLAESQGGPISMTQKPSFLNQAIIPSAGLS
jgi:hypothetical protein